MGSLWWVQWLQSFLKFILLSCPRRVFGVLKSWASPWLSSALQWRWGHPAGEAEGVHGECQCRESAHNSFYTVTGGLSLTVSGWAETTGTSLGLNIHTNKIIFWVELRGKALKSDGAVPYPLLIVWAWVVAHGLNLLICKNSNKKTYPWQVLSEILFLKLHSIINEN